MPDRSPSSTLAYLIEAEVPASDFAADVKAGLSERPATLPPKYFYDARGAELFHEICNTTEYYVTRAEHELLNTHAATIADAIGPHANIIEPGSGAAEKVRVLLKACKDPAELTLIDISREQLEAVAGELAEDMPGLRVGAVAGDFTAPLDITGDMFAGEGKRVCFFPGGTIGNFAPDEQVKLLQHFKGFLRPGDAILLGVDRIKDAALLDAAYNDAAGLTAQFNLNILSHMQAALNAEIDMSAWEHAAFFSPSKGCIEMHLRTRRATQIEVSGDVFAFDAGETIKTEESWKFDVSRLKSLGKRAGLKLGLVWSSKGEAFSLAWLEVT